MPVYTFRCRKNHKIEVELEIEEPRPTICSACGEQLHRVYDPPAIKFVGSGFYINDSKGQK